MRIVKHGPDDIDLVIMMELKRYPPNTMRGIGAIIQRSHVTVRQRFDWLEKEGYIKRIEGAPKGSGRAKILTMKGFEYLSDHNVL